MKKRLYKFAITLIAVPLMIISALSMCLIVLTMPIIALIKPNWITVSEENENEEIY